MCPVQYGYSPAEVPALRPETGLIRVENEGGGWYFVRLNLVVHGTIPNKILRININFIL